MDRVIPSSCGLDDDVALSEIVMQCEKETRTAIRKKPVYNAKRTFKVIAFNEHLGRTMTDRNSSVTITEH